MLATIDNQAGMEKIRAKDWRKIRAVVLDSTDEEHVSKKLLRPGFPI